MYGASDASEFQNSIPKVDTIIFHIEDEPTIHIEHFFDIASLESMGLNLNETMLCCGIQGYYNDVQTIYQKLIKMFWRKAKFDTTCYHPNCARKDSESQHGDHSPSFWLHDGRKKYNNKWEQAYKDHVPRAIYKENTKKAQGKKFINHLLFNQAKIWKDVVNKSFLHKLGSKDSVSDLHKIVLFHLMEGIPFDFPHTIYLNFSHITKMLEVMMASTMIPYSTKFCGYKVFIKPSMH